MLSNQDYERLCCCCAQDLESIFGDGLLEHVEAALVGGARSGQSRQMVDLGGIGDLTSIGGLLVSIFSAVIGYITMVRTPKREAASGEGDEIVVEADIPGIEEALDEAISDLGPGQRPVALALKAEICKWLDARRVR